MGSCSTTIQKETSSKNEFEDSLSLDDNQIPYMHVYDFNEDFYSNMIEKPIAYNILELIMNGYTRIEYNDTKLLIPNEIIDLISLFHGPKILNCGDEIYAKTKNQLWLKSTIHFNKLTFDEIPQKYLGKLDDWQTVHLPKLSKLQALFIVYHFDMQQLTKGIAIDCKDRWKKWYQSRIKYVKQAGEAVPEEPKFQYDQLMKRRKPNEISQLQEQCGVLVHYDGWQQKWDEWIFFDENTMCSCHQRCQNKWWSEHRIALPNSQTKLPVNINIGWLFIGEWIFLQNETICTCDSIDNCDNPCHRIKFI